jgi:hypothetical protein
MRFQYLRGMDTGTDKRYVRRNDDGTFKESDDVGRSLAQDVKKPAKTVAKPGQGDKGDESPQGEMTREGRINGFVELRQRSHPALQ